MSTAEISELQKLPTPAKLELIEALWRSIGDDVDDLPLSEEQELLLASRLKADLEHPEEAISLEELMTRVEALR